MPSKRRPLRAQVYLGCATEAADFIPNRGMDFWTDLNTPQLRGTATTNQARQSFTELDLLVFMGEFS